MTKLRCSSRLLASLLAASVATAGSAVDAFECVPWKAYATSSFAVQVWDGLGSDCGLLPGATVTVRRTTGKRVVSGVADGEYAYFRALDLPPGNYDIEVRFRGFGGFAGRVYVRKDAPIRTLAVALTGGCPEACTTGQEVPLRRSPKCLRGGTCRPTGGCS